MTNHLLLAVEQISLAFAAANQPAVGVFGVIHLVLMVAT